MMMQTPTTTTTTTTTSIMIVSILTMMILTSYLPTLVEADADFSSSTSSPSSSSTTLLTTLDLITNSVVIGAPVWIFFFQGPLLFTYMGRDKFIHPMMKLTSLLFRWTLPTFSTISLLCCILSAEKIYDNNNEGMLSSKSIIFGGLSLCMILLNSIIVVPKALKAGLRSVKSADKSTNVKDFAIDGASTSNTKTSHQTVTILVLLAETFAMLHVYYVVGSS